MPLSAGMGHELLQLQGPGSHTRLSAVLTAVLAHLAMHFVSGLGETEGERMCWSNAELEHQGQAWGVYPRTGAQKHPHAGQLCSEHNSDPVMVISLL